MRNPVRVDQLFVELTNTCNFECGFCPASTMRRERKHIPLPLFKKTIDDAVDGHVARHVGLHCMGEPMLHPRLYEAIEYAASRGLRVNLTTNGSLLTPERMRRLADAGLGRLIISLVTSDAGEHASRHAKGTYAAYYGGIMEAIGSAHGNGSSMTIGVRVMSSWTRRLFDLGRMESLHVNPSIPIWRRRMAALAVDLGRAAGQELRHENVLARLGEIDMRRDADLRVVEGLDIIPRTFGDWGNAFAGRRVHPVHFGYCPAAARTVTVLSSGVVVACCLDYEGHTPLGDVSGQSLGDIVRGPTLDWMMSGFERLRVVNPACRSCLGASGRAKAFVKGLATIALFKLRDPVEVPVIDLQLG